MQGICCEKSKLERVKEFYERTAEEYEREYERPYCKLYHEITWSNIKQFLPKEKNAIILDAGGGIGYWAIMLAKHGYKVVLTDIARAKFCAIFYAPLINFFIRTGPTRR